MFKSLHIVKKLNAETDPRVEAISDALRAVAKSSGRPVVGVKELAPTTLIVAVGGDGTMLQAMRLSVQSGGVAIGINLGRVGFLTDLAGGPESIQQLKQFVDQLLNEQCRSSYIETRMVLVNDRAQDTISCNEISLSSPYSDTMITYRLKVNDMSAGVHRANSILVSTSTGSTAYSLSSGGALMFPSLDAIQIVPVAPMTMTSRPLILCPDAVVTIDIESNGVVVRSDGVIVAGQPQRATREKPFTIQIKRHPQYARILHAQDWNFFDVLTEKLGWKKDE